MRYFLARNLPWISTLLIGVKLLTLGVMFVTRGIAIRNQIRDELLEEQIMTAREATIPGVLVQDAVTARAQAEVIKAHTLGEHGPLGSIPRDDPRRQQYVSGIALRTALNVAEMGFGVTDLVIGLGAVLAGTGAATVTLATPALYMLGREAVKR